MLFACVAFALALAAAACGEKSENVAVALTAEPAAVVSESTAVASSSEPAAALNPRQARLARRLDSALALAGRVTGGPGATAAIVHKGELVWEGAAGLARVKPERRMTPEDKFAIASITKMYTATLAMLLVEGGKLDLDEPISEALPEIRNADRITTRMLLKHRSGIGDYFANGEFARILRADPTHEWTREEVLGFIRGSRFPPGARYSYSNSGYVAAGGVLEHAAGAPVDQLFDELIAAPLGLSESTFTYDPERSDEFAAPYRIRRGRPISRLAPGGILSSDFIGPVWTDGGLGQTAADLALFTNALFDGRVVSPESLEQMLPPGGRGYGLGMYRFGAAGASWWGHDGSYGGYTSESYTDRDRDLTISVLANNAKAYRIWLALALVLRGK